MNEIEVKVLEINRNKLVAKLKSLGAKKTFSGKLENRYFDFQNRLLSNSKTVLRLRRETKTGVLCIKQSISNKGAKQMREFEARVRFNPTKRLLQQLGFVCIQSLTKRRESWKIGKIHFDFDRYLGKHKRIPEFLEIEGPSIRAIQSAAASLGISLKDLKPWGADRLLKHYRLKD